MHHHQNPSSSQTLVHSPFGKVYVLMLGFPGGLAVKNPPAMQETQVQSLSREDFLEKDMATHSRILAWRIPWTEEPGGLQSIGSQRVGCDSRHTCLDVPLSFASFLSKEVSLLILVSEADLSLQSCRRVSSCLNPRHCWVTIIHSFIHWANIFQCLFLPETLLNVRHAVGKETNTTPSSWSSHCTKKGTTK